MTAEVEINGKGYVPEDEARELRRRLTEALGHLRAIGMFSPMNLADLVGYLEDMFNQVDDRLGQLEYRLDHAGIKRPEDGIPDDVTDDYFTLPSLSGFEWRNGNPL